MNHHAVATLLALVAASAEPEVPASPAEFLPLPVPHGASSYVGMLHHSDYGDEPVKITLTVQNKTESAVWEYAGQWLVTPYDGAHLTKVPLQAEAIKISVSGSGWSQRIMIQNTAGHGVTFLDGKVDAGSGRLYGSLTQNGVSGGAFELHPVPEADRFPPKAAAPHNSPKAPTSVAVDAGADNMPLQPFIATNLTNMDVPSGSLSVSVGTDGHVNPILSSAKTEVSLGKVPPAQLPRQKWTQLQHRRERLESRKEKLAKQSASDLQKEIDSIVSAAQEDEPPEQARGGSVRSEGTMHSQVPAQSASTVRAEVTVVTV